MEVKSSTIKSINYSDTDLLVEFVSGNKYEFHNVKKDVYENFINSESKGKYFASNIKGKYDFCRIRWSDKTENLLL